MNQSKGDGLPEEKYDDLPVEGPYDPRKDDKLTRQEWRHIKRIKYDYYLMDKEVLDLIEKREKVKEEKLKNELEMKLLENDVKEAQIVEEARFTNDVDDNVDDDVSSKDEGIDDGDDDFDDSNDDNNMANDETMMM